MNSTYDVIVVGGGPAGALAAWRLAKAGVAIAVLEKAALPPDADDDHIKAAAKINIADTSPDKLRARRDHDLYQLVRNVVIRSAVSIMLLLVHFRRAQPDRRILAQGRQFLGADTGAGVGDADANRVRPNRHAVHR